MLRSTLVIGTSSTGMPRETSTRPAAPGTTLELFAPTTTASTQASTSSPLITSRSARRSLAMWLGRTSRSSGFWAGRARTSTSTRSPPTASTSSRWSLMVATTRIRSAATVSTGKPSAKARRRVTTRIMCTPLECIGRMRAENEARLEEDLVHHARAPAVVRPGDPVRPVGVLVGEAEAQEFGRLEGHVGLHRPFTARRGRVLRPVVPEAERPALPGLELRIRVPSPALPGPRPAHVVDPVAIGVAPDVDLPAREQRLPGQPEQRVPPALRHQLVLEIDPGQAAATLLGRLAAGGGDAELDRAGVVELEEGADPGGDQGRPQAAPAEGVLVVAREDAQQRLEVKGQRRHPGELGAVLDQPLRAEEAREDIGAIGLGQVVLVELVEHAEAVQHTAQLELGAEGQGEEGEMRLRHLHLEAALAVLDRLADLDPRHAPRIRVDLAEEPHLDRAREEAVLLT